MEKSLILFTSDVFTNILKRKFKEKKFSKKIESSFSPKIIFALNVTFL